MELLRALATLAEPPVPEHHGLSTLLELPPPPERAEHTDLFDFQLYPYASVYLGPEGMVGGEARDRIAGFWRALGLAAPAESDHLTVLLAGCAELADRRREAADGESRARWEHAERVFLWEHVLSWMPVYLLAVERIAQGFYRAWGKILLEFLTKAAERSGSAVAVPAHFSTPRPAADPRQEGARAFLESLLAPARSGIVLVKSDLARAAAELDLVARQGERRYVLEAFLGQDAAATLGWLASEASSQAAQIDGLSPALTSVTTIWSKRARASARMLKELAAEA